MREFAGGTEVGRVCNGLGMKREREGGYTASHTLLSLGDEEGDLHQGLGRRQEEAVAAT